MKAKLRDIASAMLVLQGLRAQGEQLRCLDDALSIEEMLDFVHQMAMEAIAAID